LPMMEKVANTIDVTGHRVRCYGTPNFFFFFVVGGGGVEIVLYAHTSSVLGIKL